MHIKIENVIWQFAKHYRKLFIANNPRKPISMSIAAAATFHALRDVGHAVEEVDADGTVCWRATPKFLRETGLEPGPLITL